MASLSSIAFYCFTTAAVLSLLIGILYAFRSKIMPYHEKALETDWEQIDPKFQFLLRAMLNGGGFFGISSAIFMLILLFIPLKDGQIWAGYAVGIGGLVGTLPLAWIVYQVKTKTAGNPPLWIMIVINCLMLLGLATLFLS